MKANTSGSVEQRGGASKSTSSNNTATLTFSSINSQGPAMFWEQWRMQKKLYLVSDLKEYTNKDMNRQSLEEGSQKYMKRCSDSSIVGKSANQNINEM